MLCERKATGEGARFVQEGTARQSQSATGSTKFSCLRQASGRKPVRRNSESAAQRPLYNDGGAKLHFESARAGAFPLYRVGQIQSNRRRNRINAARYLGSQPQNIRGRCQFLE